MSQSLSVCLLTFDSMRTLDACLRPLLELGDDLVVVDSGSTDGTLEYLASQGVHPLHRPYDTHASQMNYAISQARHDWVLCLDSDEYLDAQTAASIRSLLLRLEDPGVGYRIVRHWHVLGREVRAIYPVSSPDRPVRLFNRRHVRFNDQPVDDKPAGFARSEVIRGHVVHDTFFSLHEVFAKLNGYTTRLVHHKHVAPSLLRTCFSPPLAFLKWYFRKGAWRDGAHGLVTASYAMAYSFLKYLKAWAKERGIPLDAARR
ncbi:MAG: glycosyltransferase family 2 protein [Pseudomonadota bacterium]